MEAFHELATRNGAYVPELSSKFVTEKTLTLMTTGKIFSLPQNKVVFRICTRQPQKMYLVLELEDLLKPHGIASGFDHVKRNYPDKNWLVLAISTLSGGAHPIFHKNYMPPSKKTRDQILANPDRPVFDHIPPHLRGTGKGRHITFSTVSKVNRVEQQIMASEQRIVKQ